MPPKQQAKPVLPVRKILQTGARANSRTQILNRGLNANRFNGDNNNSPELAEAAALQALELEKEAQLQQQIEEAELAEAESLRAIGNRRRQIAQSAAKTFANKTTGTAAKVVTRAAFRTTIVPILITTLLICCVVFTVIIGVCAVVGQCFSQAGSPNSTLEDKIRGAQAAGCFEERLDPQASRLCVQFNKFCDASTDERAIFLKASKDNQTILGNAKCEESFDANRANGWITSL